MKIDFHIHTIQNKFLDEDFNFDISFLKAYVLQNNFSAIAITNHNLFNKEQFLNIIDELKEFNCLVLPGMELSVANGHILIIGDATDSFYNDLIDLSSKIEKEEKDDHFKLSIEEFNALCSNKNYLIIPHYYKKPNISDEIISEFKEKPFTGEVDSPKKFFRLKKERKLTPVYFSDIRIGKSNNISDYSEKSRFTYLNCDDKKFSSIKISLRNNDNTALSLNNIPNVFDILDGNATASTGINVLIGNRSSGKTFTLDHIAESNSASVLYIKQFEISKNCDPKQFKAGLYNESSSYTIQYFKKFNAILDYIDQANVVTAEDTIFPFLDSLIQNASNKISDIYSKSSLFNYSPFEIKGIDYYKNLICSIKNLLNATSPQKEEIEKMISKEQLLSLIDCFKADGKKAFRRNKLCEKANDAMKNISCLLGLQSSVVQIKTVNLSNVLKSRYLRVKFNGLVNKFKSKNILEQQSLQKFKYLITTYKAKNKTKLKSVLGVDNHSSIDYLIQEDPINAYLLAKNDKNIKHGYGDERFRLFFDYEVTIENKFGKEISGGQRAEFLLLNKLANYQSYDIVLIDEMESSFDNPFLNKEIISQIKKISECATVFISTHNNNLGVSLCPDYYIYHVVNDINGEPCFQHFCGESSNEYLEDVHGNKVNLSKVLLETMEANKKAYNEREVKYENT